MLYIHIVVNRLPLLLQNDDFLKKSQKGEGIQRFLSLEDPDLDLQQVSTFSTWA
jgi:hypothetical protein